LMLLHWSQTQLSKLAPQAVWAHCVKVLGTARFQGRDPIQMSSFSGV
jgi:hypothetical protein